LRELRVCSQNISQFLNEYEAFVPQIAEELGRSEAKLKSLERKLSGSARTSAKLLRRRISECRVELGDENKIREIYIEMITVIEEIRNYKRDLDWER
jgi:hypothetical protein